MTLPIFFPPIYKYKAVAMNKSRKIFPVSQCGKNREGSLGKCADIRGIRARSIIYGTNPVQIQVLPRSQLCSAEGQSGSFIPVWEGLVLILPPGEAVGPAGNHSGEKTQMRRLTM